MDAEVYLVMKVACLKAEANLDCPDCPDIKSCQNCKFYTADKIRCNHEYWNLCIKRDDEGYVKSYNYHHFH